MKKAIIFLSTAICILSCAKFDDSAIWDELKEHEERISRLETLCNRMNTNIASLQTIVAALQESDYITNVATITENGIAIGYTITFSKSGSVTIYHGKDGADGKDGKDGAPGQDGMDGQTPVIGIRKDVDGIYYWTLNEEWLLDEEGNKIRTTGKDGQDGAPGTPGQDGEDGAAGAPGQDGEDGTDGVTPLLKIEDEYWYISYDNGNTWQQLGKATGEDGAPGQDGEDGKDGLSGDSMFTNVDFSNSGYVIFELLDGTQIKIPTWQSFEDLLTLVTKMNSNLESLQKIVAALENNDYVTFVTPVIENGIEVGYTITFAKSGSITIFHGKDGKDGADGLPGAPGQDGADGKDGQTPVIGVKKDTDGVYYWTLNGEWLLDEDGNKIRTTGENGADGAPGTPGQDGTDGKDGADGQPGAPGQDGAAGADGATPQLKIEYGYWYISYDNGVSWEQLGKATGEDGKNGEPGAPGQDGADGKDGVDGDSMFSSVDVSNTDYVLIVLSDGTQVKIPTWKAFEDLQAMVNRINSNLSALQTVVEALQSNDYVTSVVPVSENGVVVGYSITFSKSGSVTIYHGKDGQNGADGAPGADGADGADGKDGQTPVIGVKKDTDGVYYWTLNGEWLLDEDGNKIRTTGENGADGAPGTPGQDGTDGKDGADGQPGAPGQDGAAGADGATPQLKIEYGYWYISYDNGVSWEQLGKATGEDGADGAPGSNATCAFNSVNWDSDYLYLELADGQTFKIPQASLIEAGNGVSISLDTIKEFSAIFSGWFTDMGVDAKVTVYYSTSSSLSLYNYQGSASRTSFSGSYYTLTVDKLFAETTYYYFTETVNNGKTVYSDISYFKTKEVTGYDNQFSTDGALNLSADGTANCYIVTQPGTYYISPVKGNSTTSVGTISTATVIWETFGTSETPTRGALVRGALYQNGNVYFKTNDTFKEGNALIAVKDASGNILWSWHIWLTDQPAEQVYYRSAGTVMDRNLGATSATPGDVGALGLMYQWGRKDPFLGSSSTTSPVIAMSTITWPSPKTSNSTTGTIAYATKNPTILLKGTTDNEWMHVTDKTLWASEKTMYDPCPAGWQIPATGENGYWVKAYGSYRINGDIFDYTNRGINFSGYFGSDATIWYPATGYYGSANGLFYGTGENGSYPGYTLGDTYGFLQYCVMSDQDYLYMLYVSDMGGADPVRCVKE